MQIPKNARKKSPVKFRPVLVNFCLFWARISPEWFNIFASGLFASALYSFCFTSDQISSNSVKWLERKMHENWPFSSLFFSLKKNISTRAFALRVWQWVGKNLTRRKSLELLLRKRWKTIILTTFLYFMDEPDFFGKSGSVSFHHLSMSHSVSCFKITVRAIHILIN